MSVATDMNDSEMQETEPASEMQSESPELIDSNEFPSEPESKRTAHGSPQTLSREQSR